MVIYAPFPPKHRRASVWCPTLVWSRPEVRLCNTSWPFNQKFSVKRVSESWIRKINTLPTAQICFFEIVINGLYCLSPLLYTVHYFFSLFENRNTLKHLIARSSELSLFKKSKMFFPHVEIQIKLLQLWPRLFEVQRCTWGLEVWPAELELCFYKLWSCGHVPTPSPPTTQSLKHTQEPERLKYPEGKDMKSLSVCVSSPRTRLWLCIS